jgi:hypothetical protein
MAAFNNSAQGFHDDAVHERLFLLAEPTNLLVISLRGAGQKSLLANIRAAADLASPDAFLASPSGPAAAAASPDPRCLTVNNAHCAAFPLGGGTAQIRDHNRGRLNKYLRHGLAPAAAATETGPKGKKGKVDGVLFVVDGEAWPAHDAARDALVALLEMEEEALRGVPVAVFLIRSTMTGWMSAGWRSERWL